MRDCSAATAALLANPPPGLLAADLFTFTLQDLVTTYRWTSFDCDLLVNGNVYSSRAPWLQRSQWNVANTMEVPTLEVFLSALDAGFSGGIDIKGQLTNGLFDGTTATLDRIWFTAGTTVINDYSGIPMPGAGTAGLAVNLSWWQNTFIQSGGNDEAQMGIQFLDATFTPIGSVLWAGLTQPTVWTQRTLSTTTPSGWQYIQVWQDHVRLAGTNNDGYIDEITLTVGGFTVPVANPGAEQGVVYWTNTLGAIRARTGSVTGLDGIYYFDGGVSVQSTAYQYIPVPHPGVRLFGGSVANIDIAGNEATINVKGKSNLLDQYAPRNLYQLGCEHAFCDQGCTLARENFTANYTVGSGSGGPTRTFIPWNGAAPGNAASYRYGTATFTSGVCAGQSRAVRLGDSTGLTLIHPLIGTPAIGDHFIAFEGCDKQLNSGSGQDCTARSNTQHWRAFPFVPPADSAA